MGKYENLKAKIKRIQQKCPSSQCIFYNGYLIANAQIDDYDYCTIITTLDYSYTVEWWGYHPNGKIWNNYEKWDSWNFDLSEYERWNKVPGFEKALEQYQQWYGVKMNLS